MRCEVKKSRNPISNVVVTKTLAPSNVCRPDRWAAKTGLKYNNNSVPSSPIIRQLLSIYTHIQATTRLPGQEKINKNGENLNILTPKYLWFFTPRSCSSNHILVIAPSWITIYLMSKSCRYFSSLVFLTFTTSSRTCRTCNLFLCKSSHLTTINIICGHTATTCYHQAGSEKTDSSFFNSLSLSPLGATGGGGGVGPAGHGN